MEIVALILAKSDSKRLPNKNILKFNGMPMFLWNVKKCLRIFEKVYVSSDSDKILKLAKKVGAIPIKRPKSLCGDVPNIPVYQQALSFMDFPDAIVAIQANSPTIDRKLIILATELLEFRFKEIMTCYSNHKPYGSIWAMTIDRLLNYQDYYKPNPEVMLIDPSIDIHTKEDFKKALCQFKTRKS